MLIPVRSVKAARAAIMGNPVTHQAARSAGYTTVAEFVEDVLGLNPAPEEVVRWADSLHDRRRSELAHITWAIETEAPIDWGKVEEMRW